MRNKMVMLLAVIIIFTAGGCGRKIDNNNGSSEKTLNLWHIWYHNPNDENSTAIVENVIQEFMNRNPNIKIKVSAVESESYKTKIKTAMAANEEPDIFYSWGNGFAQPFVESGKVLALDDFIKDGTGDKIIKGMLDNVTYDGRVYGLPMTFSIGTFYCNTELFNRYGVKLPDNYEELLAAVKAFRENKISPLLIGEAHQWTGMFYYNILALREGGAELNKRALMGRESFMDKPFLQAAEKLQQLVRAGAFDDRFMNMTRDESEIVFKSGQIPMYFTGNWFLGDIQDIDSKVKDKVAVRTFPLIEKGKGNEKEFLGGAMDFLMVSSKTRYKEESAAAVKFMTENISKRFYEFGAGLPAWKSEQSGTQVYKLSEELNNLTKGGSFVPYWDIYLGEKDGTVHKELVNRLLKLQLTPEQFAKEMDKLGFNR